MIENILQVLFSVESDRSEELCAFAETGDVDGFNALLNQLLPTAPPEPSVAASKQASWSRTSQPTSPGDVYGNPDYSIIDDGVSLQMVRAQDRAGAIYDEGAFRHCLVVLVLRLRFLVF